MKKGTAGRRPRRGAADQRAKSPTEAPQRRSATDRIRAAAIELFKARGYHGTSVRELAQALQIEAASLYYYYPSKQEILLDLFNQTMDDLLDGLSRALENGSTPRQRLRAAVRFHVQFHMERQDEAFISHSELRALTARNLKGIIVKRDRYERMLRELLEDGVRAGEFEIGDVPLTSTAILMMCSGVSDWFAKQGRLAPDMVTTHYADMVIRLVAPGR